MVQQKLYDPEILEVLENEADTTKSRFGAKNMHFFRKTKISRDSGGVRTSAVDMFYLKDNNLSF